MQIRLWCLLFTTLLLGAPAHAEEDAQEKISIPLVLPKESVDTGAIYLPGPDGKPVESTLVPYLQNRLTGYLGQYGDPIAGAVLIDARTGDILAMVQGRHPEKWNATTHTALHAHFPAASLFKTVVAGAAFELADFSPTQPKGLQGGCAQVRPSGVWLEDEVRNHKNEISLYRAYGKSCNGFFAKLGVNALGLNALKRYAMKFGWDGNIQTDFKFDQSPMEAPSVRSSSVHAVGRFAAGFGYVGISAVHAAWQMLAIGNNGLKMPIRIIKRPPNTLPAVPSPLLANFNPDDIMISADAAANLRGIMEATVNRGTAGYAFQRGKYRQLRPHVSGKTGTLTGKAPKGVTTWFAGIMPRENPEVIVAAVVVLEKLWHIKGPNLAAEALLAYEEWQRFERSKVAAR